MPEVQRSQQGGEMSRRFAEFVIMQAQNAALFLGQVPHPQSGRPEVNLEVARMFIDQLEMIVDKTEGNLSSEEGQLLTGTLTELRMAFVRANGGAIDSLSSSEPAPQAIATPPSDPSPSTGTGTEAEPSAGDDGESRKKFTKSYGA